MGSDWAETTLGELCESQGGSIQTGPFGSQLHASDYQDAGTPVVMPVNLVDGRVSEAGIARVGEAHVSRLARHKLMPGDIVFSRRGDVTRFALITERERGWLCGTGCLKVSLGEQELATAEFVAGVLSLPESKEWLVQHAVGATMPNLNTSILSALPVRLPDLTTQRSATSLLTALAARMEILRQTNVTLEAIAHTLFKSWFVDFDPVRAKAEGREPEGIDAAIADLFPSELQQSKMGPVPAGWNTGTLADLSDLNSSKWNARNHPVSVGYIDLGGVRNNRIDPPSELPFGEAPSRARHHLREGDTIVGTVRPGNRAFAYIHQPEENLTGSTGFAVLSPRSSEASSFVYLAATGDLAIDRLANLADGAAYPAVRPAVVSDTLCVIPPENVMKAFSGLTKPLLERIAQNNFTVHALANLRDTLLPRLISGKLCLPAVDNDIGSSEA